MQLPSTLCCLPDLLGHHAMQTNKNWLLWEPALRIIQGENCWGSPQFMSTDAHFWVKIGFKFHSLGKITNISTSDPPVLLGQFSHSSYSIRTVKDWNSLPQSVVSAGSLALFKSRRTSHVAPWLHSPSGALPTNSPDPDIAKPHA